MDPFWHYWRGLTAVAADPEVFVRPFRVHPCTRHWRDVDAETKEIGTIEKKDPRAEKNDMGLDWFPWGSLWLPTTLGTTKRPSTWLQKMSQNNPKWGPWGSPGGIFGPLGCQNGSWRGKLAPRWGKLGPKWAKTRSSWGQVGDQWGQIGAKLAPRCLQEGPKRRQVEVPGAFLEHFWTTWVQKC